MWPTLIIVCKAPADESTIAKRHPPVTLFIALELNEWEQPPTVALAFLGEGWGEGGGEFS